MKREMRVLLVSILLVSAGLAGCLGGTDGGGNQTGLNASQGNASGSSVGSPSGIQPGQVLVQANTTPIEPVRIQENGTLGPGAMLNVQINDESYYNERDEYIVSDQLPEGVATRVDVNISWDPPSAGSGNVVYGFLDWEGDAVSEYDAPEYDYDGGSLELSALLQPAGSGEVVLVVGRNPQADESVEESYQLDMQITPFTSQIPREAIGAVEVPQGGSLFAEPVENTSGALLVYDETNTLTKSVNVTERTLLIQNASQATEYVLLPPADDLSARIHVAQNPDAPEPVLRHLPVQWTTETTSVPPQGSTSIELDVDPAPLRFRVQISAPSSNQWYHTQGGSLQVTGPNATEVLSAEPITCSGIGWCSWMTPFGDAELPPGGYTVNYSSDSSANMDLEATVAQYVR